ncbi:MAG: DUF6157 family protein [Chloroherpetonaceae bacterium]|nr:DUF6157 family protein [Chloroherpetonaceae bacterium]
MTHTTNYYNTLIEVAPDTKVNQSTLPTAKKSGKSVAEMQFEMISPNPYRYTSDEVLFHIYAIRNEIPKAEIAEAKTTFFSKGQPCFRSSPLTKSHGFGVHYDENGKMALIPMESKEYQRFISDEKIKKTKAMRSSK